MQKKRALRNGFKSLKYVHIKAKSDLEKSFLGADFSKQRREGFSPNLLVTHSKSIVQTTVRFPKSEV